MGCGKPPCCSMKMGQLVASRVTGKVKEQSGNSVHGRGSVHRDVTKCYTSSGCERQDRLHMYIYLTLLQENSRAHGQKCKSAMAELVIHGHMDSPSGQTRPHDPQLLWLLSTPPSGQRLRNTNQLCRCTPWLGNCVHGLLTCYSEAGGGTGTEPECP
jgi:hypothetical protein